MGGDFSLYDGIALILATIVGVLAMRSDRTKNITDAAVGLVGPLGDRLEALEAEVSGLHRQVGELEVERDRLVAEVSELHREVGRLRSENRSLKGQVTRLQNQNAMMRKYLEEHGLDAPPEAP